MLTDRALGALERSLRGQRVLSVYVDGRVTDPARRTQWRTELAQAVEEQRALLAGATHAEREAFERAAAVLAAELRAVTGAIGAPGLVAFATEGGVQCLERLPVSVPLRVEWGEGIVLGPAMRALKESRTAAVAIVDARSARMYRYQHAALEELDELRTSVWGEPPTHMGQPPRQGFHPGTRGLAGTDAASRERRLARERLMSDLAARLAKVAGSDGWILLGGTPMAAREARGALPARLAARARIVPGLHLRATAAEIAKAAAAAASEMRRSEDLAAVERVLDGAGANGRGAAGIAGTRGAMDAGALQRLFVTLRFLDRHPAESEELIRQALARRASVEVVSGEGAERLDAEGEGVGALLRYPRSSGARSERGRATASGEGATRTP